MFPPHPSDVSKSVAGQVIDLRLAAVRATRPMESSLLPFDSLREFMAHLEARGALVRVREPVSPVLEITEIHTRLLADKGPAVWCETLEGFTMPVLTNLSGTVERVAGGMTREPHQLQEL